MIFTKRTARYTQRNFSRNVDVNYSHDKIKSHLAQVKIKQFLIEFIVCIFLPPQNWHMRSAVVDCIRSMRQALVLVVSSAWKILDHPTIIGVFLVDLAHAKLSQTFCKSYITQNTITKCRGAYPHVRRASTTVGQFNTSNTLIPKC